MNKIEKFHLENLQYLEECDVTRDGEHIHFVRNSYYFDVAVLSAEITKQIAIKFAEWLHSKECKDLIHDYNIVGEDYSIEKLYREFLKQNNE